MGLNFKAAPKNRDAKNRGLGRRFFQVESGSFLPEALRPRPVSARGGASSKRIPRPVPSFPEGFGKTVWKREVCLMVGNWDAQISLYSLYNLREDLPPISGQPQN